MQHNENLNAIFMSLTHFPQFASCSANILHVNEPYSEVCVESVCACVRQRARKRKKRD